MTNRVHVVAAVIEDRGGDIFIAKRPIDKHQGGLWEFPGGKVEPDESSFDALKRELHEEIGIEVIDAQPLIQISHDYPDKSVLLDVWRVKEFNGHAHGKENQETLWVSKQNLIQYKFPAANTPIIKAAQLPQHYAISPEPGETKEFCKSIEDLFKQGIKLLQLRLKRQFDETLVDKIASLAKKYDAKVLLNCDQELHSTYKADGRHLTSTQLLSLNERPITKDKLLAASCHNKQELEHAVNIGVDFVVLAPVLPTNSHPGATTIGWGVFSELTHTCTIPVYALGGMQKDLLETALNNGAQGIAGISLFFGNKK